MQLLTHMCFREFFKIVIQYFCLKFTISVQFHYHLNQHINVWIEMIIHKFVTTYVILYLSEFHLEFLEILNVSSGCAQLGSFFMTYSCLCVNRVIARGIARSFYRVVAPFRVVATQYSVGFKYTLFPLSKALNLCLFL